ncbi:acetyltransferase [Xylariaceae sp. FL0594]|nr:acetyltransferase [Xylariaceae sp. FL0594]
MSAKPKFHIRGLTPGPDDIRFMAEAYDSTLPHLAASGSGEQWGTTPFSERADKDEKLKTFEQARQFQETGQGDRHIRIFIAEVEVEVEVPSSLHELPSSVRVRTDNNDNDNNKKQFLAVGSVMISRGIFPSYMRLQFDRHPAVKEALLEGKDDYVYLEGLITDFRTGPWRKGAGSALIAHCREYCRENGIKTIYLDGYSGNDRVLPKYYESQGFTLVQDLEFHMPDDKIRTLAFLRIDVLE